MALQDDLKKEIAKMFADTWSTRDGEVVPEAKDLGLANEAVKLSATVLYADMSGSTKLVDGHKPHFAAEVYKAYLHCSAKIIKDSKGVITAYDGDRIMAVYIGGYKNTNAAKTALKLDWARRNVVTPAIHAQYGNVYDVRHVVGVDTSDLWVARTGVRGANDLVWVGRAANYAAKLASLSDEWTSRITADVYKNMNEEAKVSSDGRAMWEKATWTAMNGIEIYRSKWGWVV